VQKKRKNKKKKAAVLSCPARGGGPSDTTYKKSKFPCSMLGEHQSKEKGAVRYHRRWGRSPAIAVNLFSGHRRERETVKGKDCYDPVEGREADISVKAEEGGVSYRVRGGSIGEEGAEDFSRI